MLKCQCHKCKKVFNYSELSEDIKERHLSPCCEAAYSVLDEKIDKFFYQYLFINSDYRYYQY